tara:strand:- start:10926 stop:11669 length:744 start_codon:yes stop_codon:yes gene_type:complete
MVQFRKLIIFRYLYKRVFWNSLLLLSVLTIIRFSKGAIFLDLYSALIRPFWPGTLQKEWVQIGNDLEQKIKIDLLEKDNYRLREILDLKTFSSENKVSAAVISRNTDGWWQQLELNKGINNGIEIGDSVIAPGGLIGVIHSVTPTTSRVKLITAPGNKVGVWIERVRHHGILIGMGTNRVKFSFLSKETQAQVGDLVSTSPASTITPPNLPVGIIQSIDLDSAAVPFAIVQLIAFPNAIDWVQVIKS